MKQVGTHLVVDAWQSPGDLLNDPERIRRALIDAISAGGATLIDLCVHQFSPHGVTATATLAESHIAIHTWPEYGYFAADLFFCGAGNPERAMQILQTALEAKQIIMREIPRGFEPAMDLQEPFYTEHKTRPVETGALR
ncbi:MAG: adenosylmethionine decarboxylase [Oscillatoriaceae bacterium SKW80]|nr:adenosylmethionine decarboxylase [Oscillatoriaceae bacterium SKYG93]MCX8121723.1 adenosylmethionine decarboxylase [Oscillatoriaceae bacterium SKW80]MDW8453661.1 adenosylmethionine decarboxylase [Oscillatoriaceae cyanobacterium SKYGB_i_bin93]HIK28726.1 adenosylmethionine decarboxylase [Oscillatoriaceae cyanobacterium M7585_C2015_266]